MGSALAAGTSTAVPVVGRTATVVLAWVAMVAVDFLLQGGVLAPLYDWESAFLLEPGAAFARIPVAYAGLVAQAVVLAWLLPRLGARDALSGASTSAILGGALWTAFMLGLSSISTAPPVLLAGWWIAEVAELAVAGSLIGSAIAGARPRTLGLRVAGLVVACVALTIVLQSIGYARAPVLVQ